MGANPEKENKFLEIIKEVGRNAVLGIVSYLLTEGALNAIIVAVGGEKLTPQYVILITSGLTYVLRGIEKSLHDNDSRLQLPF